MKKHTPKVIAGIIVTAILLCGISFYGGMKYAGSQNNARNAQFAGGQFGGQTGTTRTRTAGMRGGAGMVSGEILSKDIKSITIKDRTGGSKIVYLGTASEIMKSVIGTLDDLAVGTNVITNGTSNADGSITATTITIRPAGSTFGGPGGVPTGAPKAQ